MTMKADGTTAAPSSITLGEALKRRLPHCAGDPHKVAYELNECFRRSNIRLLYDDIAAVPSTMLEIRAYVPPVGTAVLYVAVHGGPMPCSDNSWYWRPPTAEDPSSGSRERLERHHRYWTLDRATFEKQFGESSEQRLPESESQLPPAAPAEDQLPPMPVEDDHPEEPLAEQRPEQLLYENYREWCAPHQNHTELRAPMKANAWAPLADRLVGGKPDGVKVGLHHERLAALSTYYEQQGLNGRAGFTPSMIRDALKPSARKRDKPSVRKRDRPSK
jgi:hypothetical protein